MREVKRVTYDPIKYLKELRADLGKRGECDLWLELDFCISALEARLTSQPREGARPHPEQGGPQVLPEPRIRKGKDSERHAL